LRHHIPANGIKHLLRTNAPAGITESLKDQYRATPIVVSLFWSCIALTCRYGVCVLTISLDSVYTCVSCPQLHDLMLSPLGVEWNGPEDPAPF
jgi:hypothetical protein